MTGEHVVCDTCGKRKNRSENVFQPAPTRTKDGASGPTQRPIMRFRLCGGSEVTAVWDLCFECLSGTVVQMREVIFTHEIRFTVEDPFVGAEGPTGMDDGSTLPEIIATMRAMKALGE